MKWCNGAADYDDGTGDDGAGDDAADDGDGDGDDGDVEDGGNDGLCGACVQSSVLVEIRGKLAGLVPPRHLSHA